MEIYKGFEIREDNLYGYSLIDRSGNWCESSSSIEDLKKDVDKIIETEQFNN